MLGGAKWVLNFPLYVYLLLTLSSLSPFRAEKRSKHARVLTVHQAPSLKKWREFYWSCKQKKVTNFVCFSNIPGKQQHFSITNGKLVYCFCGESIFFRQNQPKDGFRTLYIPAVYQKFCRQDTFYPQILFTYCIHINNPLNI